MSEWSWVALGLTLTYGSIAGYVLSLRRRRSRVADDRRWQR